MSCDASGKAIAEKLSSVRPQVLRLDGSSVAVRTREFQGLPRSACATERRYRTPRRVQWSSPRLTSAPCVRDRGRLVLGTPSCRRIRRRWARPKRQTANRLGSCSDASSSGRRAILVFVLSQRAGDMKRAFTCTRARSGRLPDSPHGLPHFLEKTKITGKRLQQPIDYV